MCVPGEGKPYINICNKDKKIAKPAYSYEDTWVFFPKTSQSTMLTVVQDTAVEPRYFYLYLIFPVLHSPEFECCTGPEATPVLDFQIPSNKSINMEISREARYSDTDYIYLEFYESTAFHNIYKYLE